MDKSITATAGCTSAIMSSGGDKPAASVGLTAVKPVVRGKGKALTAIAAASGRDPASIVASTAAARARLEEEEAAEAAAQREEEKKEKSGVKATNTNKAAVVDKEDDNDDDEETGQTPSQMYNQLSEQDRYRFECFRRCGLPSHQMEHFIAKILVEEAEKRCIMREGVQAGMGFASSMVTANDGSDIREKTSISRDQSKRKKKQSMKRILKDEYKRKRIAMDQPFPYHHRPLGCSSFPGVDGTKSSPHPQLEHLVVPSSASEIVAVVSTLAKCYAQRLVAAARRVADAEMEKEKDVPKFSSTEEPTEVATTIASLATTATLPLQPHHLLDAHMYRVRAGLDPGFWMSSRVGQQQQREGGLGGNHIKGVGGIEAAALGSFDRDETCYLAALAAQDAYDREVADKSESTVRGDVIVDCQMNIDETNE